MIKINGAEIGNDPRIVAATVLCMPPNLKYWSRDALIELFVGAMELGIDAAEGMKGGTYTRFRNNTRNRIKKFKEFIHKKSRDQILETIYNEILKAEDKAPLRGFGMANKFGDPLMGDGERQTLLTPNDKLTALANKVIKINENKNRRN